VKKIIKLFMFAALFFCAALVYAQSNDYCACRCRQWTGSNLSSLCNSSLNTCCSLKQSGYSVGTNFTGSGTTVGSQSGANVTCGTACPSSQVSVNGVCKTPCPSSCPGGLVRQGNYQEDTPHTICCECPSSMTQYPGSPWCYAVLSCSGSSSQCDPPIVSAWGGIVNLRTGSGASGGDISYISGCYSTTSTLDYMKQGRGDLACAIQGPDFYNISFGCRWGGTPNYYLMCVPAQ